MNFLKSMQISASGLTAQRFRLDVIAENMANINTTRTESGGPYRRRMTVFQERGEQGLSFSEFLMGTSGRSKAAGNGVRVLQVVEDQSEFKLDYNPSHPDADEFGYVHKPNVDVAQEMVDMMAASRAYDANITAFNTFKDMAVKTLEIGK